MGDNIHSTTGTWKNNHLKNFTNEKKQEFTGECVIAEPQWYQRNKQLDQVIDKLSVRLSMKYYAD